MFGVNPYKFSVWGEGSGFSFWRIDEWERVLRAYSSAPVVKERTSQRDSISVLI